MAIDKMMLILLFFILLPYAKTYSASVDCIGVSDVGGEYSIPHKDISITVPKKAGQFELLYTVQKSIVGGQHLDIICSSSTWRVGFTLTDIPPGVIYTHDGYTIFPTTIAGIGVSYNLATSSSSASYAAWPSVYWYKTGLKSWYRYIDTWVTIRVWRTPGYAAKPGDLHFTGPNFVQVASPDNSADTINNCPSSVKLDARTCVYLSRTLVGTVAFQSGTCALTVASSRVYMGVFTGTQGLNSGWKDSSFTLVCPHAWGYAGKVEGALNPYDVNDGKITLNKKNTTLRIQINPYTPIVDANKGIFKLYSGGAEGYGIQLAWGHPSEQNNTPAKPVKFNTPINSNILSNHFLAGPYALGSHAIKSGMEGRINMSARYIRTAGIFVPGPADSAIEVLASYE